MPNAQEIFHTIADKHTHICIGAYETKDVIEQCFHEEDIQKIKLNLFMLIHRIDWIVSEAFEANKKAAQLVVLSKN